MCLCCLYFGMLFSDWGDAQTHVDDKKFRIGGDGLITLTQQEYYQNAPFVVVVKMLNLIIATAFLVVSMALEKCCPDRIL